MISALFCKEQRAATEIMALRRLVIISVNLTTDETDDPRFVGLVARIIAGAIVSHRPPEVRVFKIDHWFDHKWLGFTGKVIGALGYWSSRLTIPPFVANRVKCRWHYVWDASLVDYRFVGSGADIHNRGPASENERRYVKEIAPTSAMFWYSGDTATIDRGSLMGYIPVEQDHWLWFLAFVRDPDWCVARRKGIHEYEVRYFQEAVEAGQSGQ